MARRPPVKTSRNPVPALTAVVLFVTFLVFLPSLQNGFVTFDDPQYVGENPFIRGFTAENLRQVLTSDANELGNYHPVTLMSYMVNYSLWGADPWSYHLVNLLLHLAVVWLVYRLALKLSGMAGFRRGEWLAFGAALLFGIHPLHSESVAWISARKDLLYTLFYLASLLSWLSYTEKGGGGRYIAALGWFLLSLLSKGMAVTLPVVLLLADYLAGRRIPLRRHLAEKAPFFILSGVFGVVAVAVQQAQGATEIVAFGLTHRVVIAAYGLTQYLVKSVVPYELCGYYPYPDLKNPEIPGIWYFALVPAAAFVALVAWTAVRRRKAVFFGLAFFLLNLLPVLQLFPVGSAVMADRYSYLSFFGLFFLFAAAGVRAYERLPGRWRWPGMVLIALVLLFLSFSTVRRLPAWRDGFTFWHDVAGKYPAFYPAWNNLGEAYEARGETGEALRMFDASLAAGRNNPNAWFHRGSILGKQGKVREAIAGFTEAIRYRPGFAQAYVNRAIARAMDHDPAGALADLDTVLTLERSEAAYFNRGILKNQLNDFAGAIRDFDSAAAVNPSCVKCWYNKGRSHLLSGDFTAAETVFTRCLTMDPGYGYAYYSRALARTASGHPDSVCADLQKAMTLGIREADATFQEKCRKYSR